MKMNYVTVGTQDMNAATAFYDGLFQGQGVTRMAPSDRMTYWLGADFAFAVAIPFNGQAACAGNGTMTGFEFGSADEVTRTHRLALDLGATCAGVPSQKGPRFSGYVRDLDGNKLCFAA